MATQIYINYNGEIRGRPEYSGRGEFIRSNIIGMFKNGELKGNVSYQCIIAALKKKFEKSNRWKDPAYYEFIKREVRRLNQTGELERTRACGRSFYCLPEDITGRNQCVSVQQDNLARLNEA